VQAWTLFVGGGAVYLHDLLPAIPLGVLLTGFAVTHFRHARSLVALVAVAMLAASGAATFLTMSGAPEWDRANAHFARGLISSPIPPTWSAERDLAAYLAAHHRGHDTLVDEAQGYPIIFFSGHPEWFITTRDAEFDRGLREPVGRVRYILAAAPRLEGVLNRVNDPYPTLYARGAAWAALERDADTADPRASQWRLYRVETTP
jgi:hypothetical protein